MKLIRLELVMLVCGLLMAMAAGYYLSRGIKQLVPDKEIVLTGGVVEKLDNDPYDLRKYMGKKLIIHYWRAKGYSSDDLEAVVILGFSETGSSVEFRKTQFKDTMFNEWMQSSVFRDHIAGIAEDQ